VEFLKFPGVWKVPKDDHFVRAIPKHQQLYRGVCSLNEFAFAKKRSSSNPTPEGKMGARKKEVFFSWGTDTHSDRKDILKWRKRTPDLPRSRTRRPSLPPSARRLRPRPSE
jgi:hypothetical protein